MNPHDSQILEGIVAIQAAIEAKSRPIYQIYLVDKKRYERPFINLARIAQQAEIPLEWVTAEALGQKASGKSHGGAVAIVGQQRLSALADLSLSQPLAMLDGVEDPYNFGQAVRVLYAAGFGGLVLRPRSWATASAIIGRASAGAIERMPIAIAQTTEEAASFFAAHSARVILMAHSDEALPLDTIDLSGPLFIIIGGEKRGISRSLIEQANQIAKIPYGRDFPQSLGTVAATAIVAYEVLRQRR